jgi:hypothetical protein
VARQVLEGPDKVEHRKELVEVRRVYLASWGARTIRGRGRYEPILLSYLNKKKAQSKSSSRLITRASFNN